jgi:hypothetical protein
MKNGISVQQCLPLSEAELQRLLHPAEANLAGLQSLPEHSLKQLLLPSPMGILTFKCRIF